MSVKLLISIILLKFGCILTSYLEVEHRKPRVDRTNIVNKGVWIRNRENFQGKSSSGNFIFRGNSIDVDNILQGDFNAFDDNNAQNSPFISSYVERSKRSPNHARHRRSRKSLNNCGTKGDCGNDNGVDPSLVKSKLITKIKPSRVFNDYPYEIAILLGNSKVLDQAKNYTYIINEIKPNQNETETVLPLSDQNGHPNVSFEALVQEETYKDVNGTNNTDSVIPKRSMREYESEVIKKIEFVEEINPTTGPIVSRKQDRDVFDKESGWHQNAPIPTQVNTFKVASKDEAKKVKPITERGLLKVLAMLTKTFKKIMRQHDDIKEIHKKLHNMNVDFLKNIEVMSEKFVDFDSKYMTIVKFNERVKLLEERLHSKEQYFKTKEMELSKNLEEFENQQKKFLTQQRQFYNIQKLMLAQNEKINAKQNQIAKTQSEISHRQNNFARILKKAKQIYIDNKHLPSKLSSMFVKVKNITEANKINDYVTHTTTSTPQPTESIKINLFSIPSGVNRIENQDHLLLNERDEQSVDDLVYKYYFNNTFIDNVMKTFLSSFITHENSDVSRNVKSKRNELPQQDKLETTILLPVNKSDDDLQFEGKDLNRERRWINHHSRKKWRRKNRGKAQDDVPNEDDAKNVKAKKINGDFLQESAIKKLPDEGKEFNSALHRNDPFVMMATNFCNAVGQNTDSQILNWCVEKALRKLQNIDIKMTPPLPLSPSPSSPPSSNTKKGNPQRVFPDASLPKITQSLPPVVIDEKKTESPDSSKDPVPVVMNISLQNTPTTLKADQLKFFPDNDELESNLKQYDIEPDLEGNVYFDGSLHASDLYGKQRGRESGGSDIMPGLDSNSKIDTIDPETFDTQGMRRALLRRMTYENMLKKMSKL